MPAARERAMSVKLDRILSRFPGVRRSGNAWVTLCPAHPDKKPSLSICERNGKVLLHCFAGCKLDEVCRAASIDMQELFELKGSSASERRSHAHKRKIAATYNYIDERGELLFQTVRYEPKEFSQRRPNGRGRWIDNLNGVRRVLYHLPDVLRCSEIILTEGEKDAESARAIGLCATTSAGGANAQWLPEYTQAVRGKHVFIIADSDLPGRKKAQAIASAIFGAAASIRILEMPAAKDLSEWVEKGGTREELLSLLNSSPEWKPILVDGVAVLDAVAAYIRRFVSLSESQARLAALWTIHTHVFSATGCTAYMAITSPEKQSGKSRLLEVFETLVANPWLTGRVTAAVLVRKIDSEQPTLLLDESDAAFGGEKEYAEALRGVLNTGNRRSGKASCCVGKGSETTFRDFSTFCPKAIAGIGSLPDTVADRSIPIRLKRAARGEVEKFRRRDVEAEATELRHKVENYAFAIAERVGDARPAMPDELSDRQQDATESLLAIADLAGGDWPTATRSALIALCIEAQDSDESIGRALLSDIRQIFDTKGGDRIPSAALADALAEIETSSWGEWSHGRPISQAKVARLLRPYGITPHNVRIGETVLKGYEAENFADAWKRYLRVSVPRPGTHACSKTATPLHASIHAGFHDFQAATMDEAVAAPKCGIPNKDVPCSGVAVSRAPRAENKGSEEEL
jgi:hypothetical protein